MSVSRKANHRSAAAAEIEKIAALFHMFIQQLTKGHDDGAVRDLPLAQLRLCNALCAGPRPMSEVGRELGTSLSAVTQTADRLERAKLVKRTPRDGDRRVRCLRLTDRGQKIIRLHEEARIERMANVLGQMTAKERKAVASALKAMLRAGIAANGNGDGRKIRTG